MPKCLHDLEAAWCGDCKAAKARRKGTAASTRSKKPATAGKDASASVPRMVTPKTRLGASGSRPEDQGAPAGRARGTTAKRAPRAGETVRKVAVPQRSGRQAGASRTSAAPAPAASPGVPKLLQRRRRGLADAEKLLAKAQRTGIGVTAARERLDIARQRLREAERGASLVETVRGPGPEGSAHGPPRVDPVDTLTDRGGAASPPHLDPDLREGLVWVLRSGSVYHRRDCHVVEARQGAVSLKRSKAQALGFLRCEVCSPLA